MGAAEGLKSAFSFLTVLPAGSGSIEEMAEHAYFFPVVGAFIGLVSGALGLLLFRLLPAPLAGLLALFSLLLLTGLNHLDGVLDLGDALMLRGSREERLQALHDRSHGVGGFTSLYFLLSLTAVTFLLLREHLFVALPVAEAHAKLSMVMGGCLGRPHSRGIGRRFILGVRRKTRENLALGTAGSFCLALLLAPPALAVSVLFVVLLFSVIWVRYLQRLFGCITGDMLGCMNEISRLLCLFLFLILGESK